MYSHHQRPRNRSLTSFTTLYVLSFASAAILTQQWEFLYTMLLPVVMMLAIYLSHRRLNFSPSLLWMLSFWALLHFIGNFTPLTSLIPGIGTDQLLSSFWLIHPALRLHVLLHTFGFALLTWLSWQMVSTQIHLRYQRRLHPSVDLLMLCGTAAMGVCATGEIIHFLSSKAFLSIPPASAHQITWNLIASFLGASITSLLIKIRHL